MRYALEVVIPIINRLFEPLGLLDPDHFSVTEFGASGAASGSDVSVGMEMTEAIAINQRFYELVSKGQHQILESLNLDIDPETATSGFWIAITNQRINLIPYIVRRYHIELETIQAALTDSELPPAIKGFLEFHARSVQLSRRADAATIVSAEEKASDETALFLRFSEEGNQQALIAADFSIDESTAVAGFLLAVNNARVNIITIYRKALWYCNGSYSGRFAKRRYCAIHQRIFRKASSKICECCGRH